jgi:membrane protein
LTTPALVAREGLVALVEQARSRVEARRGSGLGRFLAEYDADRADDQAALIAYAALFSVFPMIGGLLTVLGLVIRDPERYAAVVEALVRRFPAELMGLLDFLTETRQIAGLLGVISFLRLLWSATSVRGRMATAFNVFYGLEERGLVGQTLTSFAMVFVTGVLFTISIGAAGAALFVLELAARYSLLPAPHLGSAVSLIGRAVSLGAGVLQFLITYRAVPNGPMRLTQVWPGALLAVVLFSLVNQLWPLYIQFVGDGFAFYKTLGLFLLLLTWLHLLARILVRGGVLNAFLYPVNRGVHAASEAVSAAKK